MKFIMFMILALSSFTLYADDTEVEKIPVKEIKAYVETINPETTCLDEYLKRRKQLIIKLSAAPVTVAVGTAASFYGGALAGAGAAYVIQPDGWGALTYVVGGAFLGVAAGAVSTTADTVATAVQLRNVNLIIQTLASHHMDRESDKVEKLYSKYLKKSERDLDQQEFVKRLVELDVSGKLCDGSLVKQTLVKLGPKLAFKVAKVKGLVRGVDQLP
jgi:hypothetical protein